MHTIYRQEGFLSLYRGVIVNLVAGSLANMAFFYVYQDGKKRYSYDQANPNSLKTVWISFRAGIISMFLCAPLWIIKTRMVLFREQFDLNVIFDLCLTNYVGKLEFQDCDQHCERHLEDGGHPRLLSRLHTECPPLQLRGHPDVLLRECEQLAWFQSENELIQGHVDSLHHWRDLEVRGIVHPPTIKCRQDASSDEKVHN